MNPCCPPQRQNFTCQTIAANNGFKMLFICTAIGLQSTAIGPQTATDKLWFHQLFSRRADVDCVFAITHVHCKPIVKFKALELPLNINIA